MKAHGRTIVVAASAGTGKTTRLTEEIKRHLLDVEEPIAPERVVAVTYTRAAAATLFARVRLALIAAGAPALAQRLAAARIGTLHSVCARLINDYALELGLTPELRVLDDRLAAHAMRIALEAEVGDDERAELDELAERFGDFDWARQVRDVIALARANDIDAEALQHSAESSVAGLLALLPDARAVGELEEELLPILGAVLAGPEPYRDNLREERRAQHEMQRALARGDALSWTQWLTLANHSSPALKRVGSAHIAHPLLRADLQRATELVVAIAQRVLGRYQGEKRRWGALDFVDQEVEALRLLRDASVHDRLREDIALVLVDEMQDTSPIQLAILSELSAIARHSVFVGDQKQAIFGFRGTDPRLMQAVVEQITTSDDVLDVSYRSRPGLVELTSALFAPAFERQGLPAARVKVRPSSTVEPDGLGHFLERWQLSPGRPLASEIAAGVAALLEDQDVRVREGGMAVPVQSKHIAVLARKNWFARAVAEQLARIGIRSQLKRGGLCATLEARALMAGLALFVDGRDALAAAELVRLTRGAADPNAWLGELLAAPRGAAFHDEPLVRAVVTTAREHRSAGVVASLDLVVDALRLRDVCVAWGDAPLRLANLGALRVLAIRYGEERAAQGAGATVTGFLAVLDLLSAPSSTGDDHDNDQGHVADEDAVHIVTWHAAKGGEWPIVVLTQLDDWNAPDAFGAHIESDVARVDLADPLRGRRLRFWPKPYARRTWQGGVLDLAATGPTARQLAQRHDEEELRLLYVGWTRARDRLVLVGSPPGHRVYDPWCGSQSLLRHLRGRAGPLLSEPDESGRAAWAGHLIDVKMRMPRTRAASPPERGTSSVPGGLAPRAYAPAFVQPSSLHGAGVAGLEHVLGPPLALHASPDDDAMTRLGSAVHAFLAAEVGIDDTARAQLAAELLARFSVEHLLAADELVEIGRRLQAGLAERFAGARLQRERPLWQRRADGSVVRGQIDMVVEVPAGLAIVDHKTYLGVTDVAAQATEFAGQLAAYAEGLGAATGRPLLALLVHLPLQGVLVEVTAAHPGA